MWNEKGFSMIESLLTISILLVLISLIPIVFQLNHSLYNKALEYHAIQVAYEGVLIAETTGMMEGSKWIDDVEFHWNVQHDAICVQYIDLDKERLKCVNGNGKF